MKDLWMNEYERTCEDYYAGEIDDQAFRCLLRQLGFDAHEIDEHIGAPRTEDAIGTARRQ